MNNKQRSVVVNDWGVLALIVGGSLLLWLGINPPQTLPDFVGQPRWRLEPVTDLALPAVHGAILSVLIPVIAAYAIYVSTAKRQLEHIVYETATKVNQINAPTYITSEVPLPGPAGYTNDEKNRLVLRFQQLVVYGAVSRQQISATEGREALGILSGFLNTAPMRTTAIRTDPSNVQLLTERVNFKDVRAVSDWVRDIGFVGVVCAMALNRADRFRQFAYASFGDHGEFNQAGTFVDALLAASNQLVGLQQSVGQALADFDDNLRRLPGRHGVVISTSLALVAFGCGVAIPLALTNLGPLIAIWIPVICYGAIFGYLGVLIARA